MFDTLSQLAAGWILPALFFWLVLCIFATNIQEWLATMMDLRAKVLASALEGMFGDPQLVQKFHENPLVRTQPHRPETKASTPAKESALLKKYRAFLRPKAEPRPEHVDPRLFAQIILHWIMDVDGAQKEKSSAARSLHANVQLMKVKYPHLAGTAEVLLSGVPEKSPPDLETFSSLQANLENWFHAVMRETTKRYKRQIQHILLSLGFCLALVANFDPIFLTTELWNASQSEQAISTLPIGWEITPLEEEANCQPFPEQDQLFGIRYLRNCIQPLTPTNTTNLILKFIGFTIGAMAIQIGSQYIFDLWRSKIAA
jgi:hypothetical protein